MGTHAVRLQSPHSLPLALTGGVRVCSFPEAATTNYDRLCASNNRNVFSHSYGGQKSEIRYHQGLVPPKALIVPSSFW